MKSVKVRPSTGESSNEPKSATCIAYNYYYYCCCYYY